MVIPRSSPGGQYFALFMATAGAAPMIATTISWTGNTWGNGNHCTFLASLSFVVTWENQGMEEIDEELKKVMSNVPSAMSDGARPLS
jgi:hypothetical protein